MDIFKWYMIGIIDGNNFYPSCEETFNPAIWGKAVVIMSNNDKAVIALNQAAKALGIKRTMPVYQVLELIRIHGVIKYSSNYTLYGDMSRRLKLLIGEWVDEVEDNSVDEAFAGFAGFKYLNLTDYAFKMRNAISQGLGVKVSIGIGATKTLAKLANDICKKHYREEGVYIIDTEEKRIEALKMTEVSDVWGVGSRITARLNKSGIYTAYDLSLVQPEIAKRNFSVVLQRTVLELNGMKCIPLELVPPPKENIASQKSFGRLQTELSPISEGLATYIARVCEKLRKQKSVAGSMKIWLGTDEFAKEDEPRYFPEITTVCDVPTDYTPYLIERGVQALKKIFKQGYEYKRVGVMLIDLRTKSDGTLNMFSDNQRVKEGKANKAIDRINFVNGRDTIRSARQGFEKGGWEMKQDNLTPKYTTRLSDIIKIK